jgi:hypothetical protein
MSIFWAFCLDIEFFFDSELRFIFPENLAKFGKFDAIKLSDFGYKKVNIIIFLVKIYGPDPLVVDVLISHDMDCFIIFVVKVLHFLQDLLLQIFRSLQLSIVASLAIQLVVAA